MREVVLGTRGSDLARAQTGLVLGALEHSARVEIIRTSGDERAGVSPPVIDRHAGRKGMFTAEIERALLKRRIDVAVHSAKDLPSDATPGLEICAALPRAAVEDVLIAKSAAELGAVAANATVATGSVRRQHQLRFIRPDLKIADLRGNVPTRVRKLIANDWAAIILARAGLERLGLFSDGGALEFEGTRLQASLLPTDEFVPAGGQGIVALQIRGDDDATRGIVGNRNHQPSLLCLRAEREFLRLLQGDCGTPVGVLATIGGGAMEMRAQIFDEGRAEPRVAALRSGTSHDEPETLAAQLFNAINGR